MSLHHLGIAHLHRQLSSPTSKTIRETSVDEDLTQDSKDVLIDRLNDLVSQLTEANSLKDSVVTSIHAQVDKIERLIKSQDGHAAQHSSGYLGAPIDDDAFWGPPTPTQSLRMRLPQMSPSAAHNPFFQEPHIANSKAEEVAKAAEDLATRMVTTVAELQKRRDESDEVHDLLLTRAERATERILLLEYRIAEMEDDFDANQSEPKYLRIQLKAIEAQCNLPRNEDPELTQAIKNWKIDWEDIDRRSKARRKKCLISVTQSSSDMSTLVDGT